ncbi:MAG TPA: SDR family NAD(P)-dependent oxidoreductase, partial [Dehalococcoidia bacterium]|nr:SDR family NAD(P)-dependent oxidoreductase [Dehalococcoidia bacterium]
MKILITGGAGFIGTALAERLVRKNKVVLFDSDFNHNVYTLSNLKSQKHAEVVEGDILDIAKVEEVVNGVEVVIHTAARLGVQEVIRNA